ncbi:MAG: alpha/beta hydrolase [Oscillospiraceae bacterium]|jgi:pimeloyl-ACP methyl ester carboxylesterase|nr:alpha/beta hydrolase [Oscillospiraceae bacterium]
MRKRTKILAIFLALVLLLPMSLTAGAQGEASLPFADSAFFEMGDYSIHYRFQPAAAEFQGRIAFLHGFLASTCEWEPMVAILTAAGYDCLLIDLPGFGYSTRETAKVAPVPREDLVAALMQELAPDGQWVLGGHSMGGGAVLTVVNKYPQLISAAMLYAPIGDFSNWGSNHSDSYTTFLGKMMNGFFRSLVNLVATPMISSWLKQGSGFDKDYDLDGKILEPLRIENTGMGYLFMMKRGTPIDFEVTKQLEMPMLLCVAEKDEAVENDGDTAILIKNSMPPQTEYVMVMDANHYFVELKADEVAAITLDFLAENNL